MKVFSKSSKGNKSTPLLHQLTDKHSAKPSGKPKGITKITTYKTKILQSFNEDSVKITTSWKDTSHSQRQNYPKTDRSQHYLGKIKNMQKSAEGYFSSQQRPNFLPIIPIINSIQYKNSKTQCDNRSSTQSNQLIESTLCYGSKIGKQNRYYKNNQNYNEQNRFNKNITSFMILGQSNKQQNASNIANNVETAYPKPYPKFEYTQKQNMFSNMTSSNCQKDNYKKQLNYYKNSKLNNYNLKPVQKKISLSLFRIGKKLGRGRFGSVHIVQQKTTGMIFALKLIDLHQVRQEQMENQIMEEIKLQLFMNHPNILKMYGCFRQGNQLCMILQYADQKCLFGKLQQKLEEKSVAYYTRQMIEALKYCHSQSILHRDLKPENILICKGVSKLADFGWAAYAPKYKRLTFCGTLDYVPPQILKGEYYDEKVDIWSLGVLIYEMAIGRAPFETKSINPSHVETKTMNRIIKGDLVIPFDLSPELRKLIYSILMTQPQKRPTLEDIESSPWLKSYKQEGTQIKREIWQFWAGSLTKR